MKESFDYTPETIRLVQQMVCQRRLDGLATDQLKNAGIHLILVKRLEQVKSGICTGA